MINAKSFKWGYGVIASLAIGLTGCSMDGQRSEQVYSAPQAKTVPQTKTTSTNAVKTSSAKREPIQQEAPGPKRAAAPQIPVIQ